MVSVDVLAALTAGVADDLSLPLPPPDTVLSIPENEARVGKPGSGADGGGCSGSWLLLDFRSGAGLSAVDR